MFAMSGYCCSDTQTATVLQGDYNITCQIKHIMTMKNIVVVLLLFVSISLGAKPKKIFIDGYGIRGDEVTVWLKNGSTKTIKKEEFDKGMYVF